ncbi:MAG TPA: hypothetical protein DCF68_11575 [Cyanothece sp. UBA12306]|nr:hypothetical protein [Cyanothece sp. UBA12306]
MTDLLTYKNQEDPNLVVDYQQELVLASKEIQSALTILENYQEKSQSNRQLAERISLVNQIVTKVTQRLQNLEEQLKLSAKTESNAQFSQNQARQKAIVQKLENIKQTVNILQYTA